ncbi:MAG: hypothetical protein ACRDDY_15150 [Clostridium sp.]|uniref:hypothetical protein n=1 Tax=Clostridium sp. TaxID=1506 RepID=UPI003EE74CE3
MKKEKVFKFLSIAIMLSIFWFSHQDGRGVTLRDIGIDLLGSISGIIGMKTVGYIKNIDLYNKNT